MTNLSLNLVLQNILKRHHRQYKQYQLKTNLKWTLLISLPKRDTKYMCFFTYFILQALLIISRTTAVTTIILEKQVICHIMPAVSNWWYYRNSNIHPTLLKKLLSNILSHLLVIPAKEELSCGVCFLCCACLSFIALCVSM